MIVVVADTSPLNHLIQIHCEHLLPALYERVLVPAAVMAELDHPATPAAAHADLLLIDEKLGVRLARQRGLKVIGTLGVLVQGAERGLVDIDATVDHLRATDFRCTPQVFEQAKRQVRAKRGDL